KTQSNNVGVSVKTFAGSALYNVLIGASNSLYLKAGVGSTKYGSSCPGTAVAGAPMCGSCTGLVGGMGFRVGVTPTVMVRVARLGTPHAATRLPTHTTTPTGATSARRPPPAS